MYFNTQKNQAGFSLIEMMIAMVIGLFLMGGVVSVYINSSQSSRVNQSMRTLQENGRFALSSLRNNIQMAGYVDSYDSEDAIDPFPNADNSFFEKLTVRFQADQDCVGADTTATHGGFAENTLEIVNGELICTGNAGGAAAPQTIITGVDQMQILYGLDDGGDGVADRYVSATTVTTNAGWKESVTSVRIALLLNSEQDIKPAAESKPYPLLDGNSANFNDRKLHKVFTSTILIRNQMK